ncbi:MAG: SDR family NAD(P)-dependent oxidoreductase [Paracoccaceae bacterium]
MELSRGIGKAIAVKLASEGADIVVNWLDDKEKASEVADLVKSQGRKVVMLKGDIGQNDQARNLVSATMDAFGKIDVLVNNAGIYPRIPFFDVTETDWNKIIQTNLKGAFFCSQMVAKKMRDLGTGGNIINISSQAISGLAKEGSVYSISKTALIGLTKTLAMELAPHRIRVNAIAPGLTDTDQPRLGLTETEISDRANNSPLGRIVYPEEVAELAAFLASKKAAMITGQTHHINSGAYLA